MSFKSQLRSQLFKRNFSVEKLSDRKSIEDFICKFRDNIVSCDLVRIGGSHDGGYLVPNLIDQLSYCFSPGVDVTSSFECELANRHNIRCFMADASVEGPPIDNANFEFTPKFLGTSSSGNTITLSDWVAQSGVLEKDDGILQMDIEGDEYNVLLYEDMSVLKRFAVIVVEFHYVDKIFYKDFLNFVSVLFEKIYSNFSICHVHPNNCCGMVSHMGFDVPRVIEVTFVRKDVLYNVSNNRQPHFPHDLDAKNVVNKGDIVMPEVWWKKRHQK